MQVVEARAVDARAIELLVARAFAPFVQRTGVRPAPLDTDWPTIVSALGARVAVLEDRVVGVLVSWPHPAHLDVELIAVDPAAQGGGIGGALLAAAERSAIAAGLPCVRLHTNVLMTQNLAWYERHGFVETSRGSEHGLDRVFLAKRLA